MAIVVCDAWLEAGTTSGRIHGLLWHPDGKHCCVLGYQPDDPEGRWLLWLERSRGFLGSVLGMRKYGIEAAAVDALQDILSNATEVRELEWQETSRR